MKDRVPTQIVNGAIRMERFNADGNSLGYIYLKRADEPEEEGTPLNKNNVLTDKTAEEIGLDPDDNPTPNDAFARLAVQIGDTITTARAVDTNRYVQCSGQQVEDSTYPDLYKAIPHRYATTAKNAEWSSASITEDSIVYHQGDYYFKLKSGSAGQWQYASSATGAWTDLPYTGKPYYTSGVYMLDSGYVNKDGLMDLQYWQKIAYSANSVPESVTYTPNEFDISANGDLTLQTVTYDYSFKDIKYNVTNDLVFIHLSYITEITDSNWYAQDDEYYYDNLETGNTELVEQTKYYRQYTQNKIIAIAADKLSESTDISLAIVLESTVQSSEILWKWSDLDYTSAAYTGYSLDNVSVYQSGNAHYLSYVYTTYDGTLTASDTEMHYQLSINNGVLVSKTAVSNETWSANPREDVVFVSKYYSSAVGTKFAPKVYVNGTAVTFSLPSGNYIYAIGYDRNHNAVVYVTNGSTVDTTWDTYVYLIDNKATLSIGTKSNLLTASDYDIMGEDNDGNVYVTGYKLTYSLACTYTFPNYSSGGDTKYMRVR